MDFGMAGVLQLAGKLITDNTPEARDSAKRIVGLVSSVFADPAVQEALNIQVGPQESGPLVGIGRWYGRCSLLLVRLVLRRSACAAMQVPEPPTPADGEEAPPKQSKWEYFCRSNLNASAAIAVLKVAD